MTSNIDRDMGFSAIFAVALLASLFIRHIQHRPTATTTITNTEYAVVRELYLTLSKSAPVLCRMNATEVLQLRCGVINESIARQTCNGMSDRAATRCAWKGLTDMMAACSGPPPSRGFPAECDAFRERMRVFMRNQRV